MNSDTNPSLEVEPVLHDEEPAQTTYEDSLEGLLQFHADRSLWFKEQSRNAKTNVKRDYYQKKLVKNNKNLWKLLVRTPNAYNPLMDILKGSEDRVEAAAADDGVILQPFCQVVDEVIESDCTITTSCGGTTTAPDYFLDFLPATASGFLTPEQEERLARQKALLDDAIIDPNIVAHSGGKGG
jgi:hypothetical protein